MWRGEFWLAGGNVLTTIGLENDFAVCQGAFRPWQWDTNKAAEGMHAHSWVCKYSLFLWEVSLQTILQLTGSYGCEMCMNRTGLNSVHTSWCLPIILHHYISWQGSRGPALHTGGFQLPKQTYSKCMRKRSVRLLEITFCRHCRSSWLAKVSKTIGHRWLQLPYQTPLDLTQEISQSFCSWKRHDRLGSL